MRNVGREGGGGMGERKRKGGERVGGGKGEKRESMREHNVVYTSLKNKN